MLPKQVAALQAVASGITQHAATLGEESRQAIDAIVRDVDKFAEIVRAQLFAMQAEPSIDPAVWRVRLSGDPLPNCVEALQHLFR